MGSGPVGESQSITFSGNPIPGVITVGGVSVELTAMENTAALATAKIAQAMKVSAQFGQGSGRNVTYAPGSTIINVDFPVTDGEVTAIDVMQRDTNLASVTDTTRRYSSSSAGTGVFAKVNENIFNLNLTSYMDPQYTIYKEDQYFDWHPDGPFGIMDARGMNCIPSYLQWRKLSAVLALTDTSK